MILRAMKHEQKQNCLHGKIGCKLSVDAGLFVKVRNWWNPPSYRRFGDSDVADILNQSPTHLVSNIRHQHRCNPEVPKELLRRIWHVRHDEGFFGRIFFIFNPYLVHFGNIQERHLWKKNPKFTFWSLMTSYVVDFLWRHINLKLHQLGYLYVTWLESRDVISVRYHVMKLITPEIPGNELTPFLEKLSI